MNSRLSNLCNLRRASQVSISWAEVASWAVLLAVVVVHMISGYDTVYSKRRDDGMPRIPPELRDAPYASGNNYFWKNNQYAAEVIDDHSRSTEADSIIEAAIRSAAVHRDRVELLFHKHSTHSELGPHHCDGREERHTFIERVYPFVYWLSANPRVDPTTGRVRGRTIPIPDFEALLTMTQSSSANVVNNTVVLPYDQRTRGLIVWRGATTGCPQEEERYHLSDRYRMVAAFRGVPSTIADVKFSYVTTNVLLSSTPEPSVKGKKSLDMVADDVLPTRAMLEFKAILDVDGDASTWSSLRWKLSSGLCVLKVRSSLNHVQWFYSELQHGVHVWLLDPNDLPEVMVEEAIRVASNKTLCESLAQHARVFAETHFNPQHMRTYLHDVLVRSVTSDNVLGRDLRIRPG